MYPESHSSLSWNESTRGSRAGRAGARDGISSSRSRNRVSAVNARSFASCSVKSFSIASAPISPTASRYGSSRAS